MSPIPTGSTMKRGQLSRKLISFVYWVLVMEAIKMRCLLKSAASPLVVLLLFVASIDQRAAAGHEISIFAQRGDVFHGRTITSISHEGPQFSINNLREIAFMARVQEDDNRFVVMTQNRFLAGGGKVVDGVVPGFNDEDNGVWINDLGQVAYSAGLLSGGSAVFLDDKLLFRSGDLIAGREASYQGSDYPVVDRFGTVAFEVALSSPRSPAIVTQYEIVAEFGDVIDGFTINSPKSPRINGDGSIAFLASTTDSDRDSAFTSDRRLIGPGDVISGIPVTEVRRIGNVNRAGIVTASFVTGTWPDYQSYAATQDELLVGPGSIVAGLEITGVGEAHMTSDGLVVFLGFTDSDDGSAIQHLFAGDEVLLSVGDEIEGHTINKIWQNFRVNESGDIVVQVRLDDIDNVIVLATVPEPSTMSMLFIGALLMLLSGRTTRAGRRR